MALIRLYFRNVLVAIDQLLNAITGGDPDETISSRCYRNRDNPICRAVLAVCNLFEKDHGAKSLEPADHHNNEIL